MQRKSIQQAVFEQNTRYNDDRELILHVTATLGLLWKGQLVPTNLWQDEQNTGRENYLHKCNECPQFSNSGNQVRQKSCSQSLQCCSLYYLVFQSVSHKDTDTVETTCCMKTPKKCRDRSRFFAVNPFVTAAQFDASKHVFPLQIEQNHRLADSLIRDCSSCEKLDRRFAGAAHWRSCATCNSWRPVETDLVRDSLVRITTIGNQYWQYKPIARTRADRVHGIFGQSVFRGQGPKHYLPDFHRRSTPVRGGYTPANIAPRAISAVGKLRMCDESVCRSVL